MQMQRKLFRSESDDTTRECLALSKTFIPAHCSISHRQEEATFFPIVFIPVRFPLSAVPQEPCHCPGSSSSVANWYCPVSNENSCQSRRHPSSLSELLTYIISSSIHALLTAARNNPSSCDLLIVGN